MISWQAAFAATRAASVRVAMQNFASSFGAAAPSEAEKQGARAEFCSSHERVSRRARGHERAGARPRRMRPSHPAHHHTRGEKREKDPPSDGRCRSEASHAIRQAGGRSTGPATAGAEPNPPTDRPKATFGTIRQIMTSMQRRLPPTDQPARTETHPMPSKLTQSNQCTQHGNPMKSE